MRISLLPSQLLQSGPRLPNTAGQVGPKDSFDPAPPPRPPLPPVPALPPPQTPVPAQPAASAVPKLLREAEALLKACDEAGLWAMANDILLRDPAHAVARVLSGYALYNLGRYDQAAYDLQVAWNSPTLPKAIKGAFAEILRDCQSKEPEVSTGRVSIGELAVAMYRQGVRRAKSWKGLQNMIAWYQGRREEPQVLAG